MDYVKKGAWSPDEDQKLVDYIMKYRIWNWSHMPKFAGSTINNTSYFIHLSFFFLGPIGERIRLNQTILILRVLLLLLGFHHHICICCCCF